MVFVKDCGTRAKVWSVEDKGKYSTGRISTSEKDREENYIYSNWFCTFVGKGHEKASSIKEGDRITIDTLKISNTSTKNADGGYTNRLDFVIFDFHSEDKKETKSGKKETKEEPKEEGFVSDNLPW